MNEQYPVFIYRTLACLKQFCLKQTQSYMGTPKAGTRLPHGLPVTLYCLLFHILNPRKHHERFIWSTLGTFLISCIRSQRRYKRVYPVNVYIFIAQWERAPSSKSPLQHLKRNLCGIAQPNNVITPQRKPMHTCSQSSQYRVPRSYQYSSCSVYPEQVSPSLMSPSHARKCHPIAMLMLKPRRTPASSPSSAPTPSSPSSY